MRKKLIHHLAFDLFTAFCEKYKCSQITRVSFKDLPKVYFMQTVVTLDSPSFLADSIFSDKKWNRGIHDSLHSVNNLLNKKKPLRETALLLYGEYQYNAQCSLRVNDFLKKRDAPSTSICEVNAGRTTPTKMLLPHAVYKQLAPITESLKPLTTDFHEMYQKLLLSKDYLEDVVDITSDDDFLASLLKEQKSTQPEKEYLYPFIRKGRNNFS